MANKRYSSRAVSGVDLAPYFETGDDATLSIDARWVVLRLEGDVAAFRAAWWAVRAEVLRQWIRVHPGTRPFAWWRCEAPEPRRRLAGAGQATHERLNVVPRDRFGLPVDWWSAGSTKGVRPRADDPPTFESQADYLARFGLLVTGEAERLPGDAFTAERIPVA